MDKTSKFLKRLSDQDRLKLKKVINNVLAGDIKNLDTKKLKGHGNMFRIRVGNMRIVFKNENNLISLIFVGRKNDVIYKKFR